MTPVSLSDNVMNRRLSPAEPKFKLWHSAGLMLTYWCSSRCACCYNFSGPQAGTPATEMSVELALACWRSVISLAGLRGKVHLTGGEPFGDYPRLREIMRQAHKEKLPGLEKVETNAYWCTDASRVRERLLELKELGLTKLQISADIYHQEYVPLERVRLARDIAIKTLGVDAVQVRWRDYVDNPVLVAEMDEPERLAAYAAELSKRKERLVGRAAKHLAPLLSDKPATEFAGQNCCRGLLGSAHVHIDGMGNVFIGTCVGIIAGKVGLQPETSLEHLWRHFDMDEHPVLTILRHSGPAGLLEEATKYGYRPLPEYASKCHMCYHVRHFLRKIEPYCHYLGPGVCHGESEKQGGYS